MPADRGLRPRAPSPRGGEQLHTMRLGVFGTALHKKYWRFPLKRPKTSPENSKRIVGQVGNPAVSCIEREREAPNKGPGRAGGWRGGGGALVDGRGEGGGPAAAGEPGHVDLVVAVGHRIVHLRSVKVKLTGLAQISQVDHPAV
jgi:hypothetical protein